ncbi:MAG: hypothetical protein WC880_04185 [Candidatus Paceibacterota bacterium]
MNKKKQPRLRLFGKFRYIQKLADNLKQNVYGDAPELIQHTYSPVNSNN